jgi:hypothetical protein
LRALTVGGLDVHVGLDEGHPLLDEGAQLVPGQVHAVEVGDDVVALHVLAAQLDLPEELVLVLVQVRQADLKDAPLQPLRGNLRAGGPGDEGLARGARREHGGGLDPVPFLLVEGVLGFLLAALLRLRQPLVLAWGRENEGGKRDRG